MEDDESSEDLEVLMIKSDHSDAKKRKKHKKKRSHSKYDEDSDRKKSRRNENKTTNDNKNSLDIIELFSTVKKKSKRKKDKKRRSKSYSEDEKVHIKTENIRYKRAEEIVVDDDDSDVEVTRTSKNHSRSIYGMSDSESDNNSFTYNYSDSDIEIENIYVEKVSKIEKKYKIPSSRDHSTFSPRKKNHKSNCRKASEKCRDEDKKERTKSDYKKDENGKERSRYENKKRSRDEDKKESSHFAHKKNEKERLRYENKKGSRNEDKKENSKHDYEKEIREILMHKNKQRSKDEDKKEKAELGHKNSERGGSRYEKTRESRDENKKDRSKSETKKYEKDKSRYDNKKVSRGEDKKGRSKTDHKYHERDKDKNERSKTDHRNTERERLRYDDKERFDTVKNDKMNRENLTSHNYPSRSDSLTHVNILKNALKIIGSNSNERLSTKSKNSNEKIRPSEYTTSGIHKEKENKTGSSKSSSKSTENVQRLVTNNNIASDSQLRPSLVMKINKNAEIDIITEVRQPQNRKKDCLTHQHKDSIEISPLISPETIKKENDINHQTFTLLHNNMPLPISPFLKKSGPVSNSTPFTNSGNLFRIESVQGNVNDNCQNFSENNLIPSQTQDIQNSDISIKQENASTTNDNTKKVENQTTKVPYVKLEEIVNVQSKTLENQKTKLPYIKIEEIITQNEIHSEVYDQVDSKAYVRSIMNNEYLENSAPESKFVLHKNIGLDNQDTVNISIINTQEKLTYAEASLTSVPGNGCVYNNDKDAVNINNKNAIQNDCDSHQASLSQYESTTNNLQKVTRLNMLPENVTSTNLKINSLASVHPLGNTNTNIELNSVDLGQPEKNTSTIIKLNSFNPVQTENITNENVEVSNLGPVQLEYVSNTNTEMNNVESHQTIKQANTNIELNSLESVQPEGLTSTNSEMNHLNTVQPPFGEFNGIDAENSCSESPMFQIESVWSTATRGATASEETDSHYPIPEELAEVIEDLAEVVEIGRVEVTSTSACSFRIKKENEAARNYYVTHRDIKNCPMCQHEIDTDRFKFNPTTMIFTMLCICNLTIYQLLNPEKYKGCRVR